MATISIASTRVITCDVNVLAYRGEYGVSFAVSLDGTLTTYVTGKDCYLYIWTPDGRQIIMGEYDGSSGTITVEFDEDDELATHDGDVWVQLVVHDAATPTEIWKSNVLKATIGKAL